MTHPGPRDRLLTDHRRGRLTLPKPDLPAPPVRAGLHSLGLAAGGRDALLYVPAGLGDEQPAMLVVLLHGAGGWAADALAPLLPHAEKGRLLLLAPDSRGRTWDMLLAGYGPDVAFLDSALSAVLARRPVHGFAIGGFSDGASYALSLGTTNGDVFDHVLAFSPGFLAPLERHGRPRIFVSHGVDDSVLPIDRCSRRLVPGLVQDGYDVCYEEFAGGHSVPATIASKAVGWLTRDQRNPDECAPVSS